MEDTLELAVKTILMALTTTWEDNGNVSAGAVRDLVTENLSTLTGLAVARIEQMVTELAEESQ